METVQGNESSISGAVLPGRQVVDTSNNNELTSRKSQIKNSEQSSSNQASTQNLPYG